MKQLPPDEHTKVIISSEDWHRLTHDMRNELMIASMTIDSLGITPKWILKTASFVISLLYRLSFRPGRPPKSIIKICQVVATKTENINSSIKELKSLAKKEELPNGQ